MTTPQNHNTQENGSAVVINGEYTNPIFDTSTLENGVIVDEDTPTALTPSDVTIEDNQDSSDSGRTFRQTTPSISLSVNYDDVANAEQLADDISVSIREPRPVYHSNRRQSGIIRRRMSRDFMGDIIEEEEDEFFHRELILKIRKTLPLKDFQDDIRARRDLEKFLISPVVLLDVTHTSLDEILEDLVAKLQKDLEVDEKIATQAGKAFFTFQDQYQNSVGSVDHLRETIQGVHYKPEGANYEESWVTALCSLPMLKRSHVGIARLRHPLNLGNKSEEVMFIVAVIAPKKEKFTKNAVEIGRTFSSLMSNAAFRHQLAAARTEEAFKDVLILQSSKYKRELNEDRLNENIAEVDEEFVNYSFKQVGQGIYDDLKRRLPHYWSDFKDGVIGKQTIYKLISTVFFLYFACLLPGIAFGTVYEKITDGKIDVTSCIVSQTIGGLIFAFFSGQPMLVLLTTAPLALYVKAIKIVSETFDLDFAAMYAMTGIWNSIFLILAALFNLSKFMKYSSRSTEEIFGFFIALAFTADAIKATIANFGKNYHFPGDLPATTTVSAVTTTTFDPGNASAIDINSTMSATTLSTATIATSTAQTLAENCYSEYKCFRPENSVLFLFLMLGTLWLGLTLLRFDQSPFLSATKREILKDYALPIAVIVLSFIGSYLFRHIPLEKFNFRPINSSDIFIVPQVSNLAPLAHVGAMGLGLCLSFLFYVDQNVSAAVVNAPQNKLKKGPAYHWDLLVIGVLNMLLSVFNLPWVHASLPHSPLHVKALADVEQHVSNVGTVYDQIVKVRETRLTSIFAHILIGLSLLIIPILQYIPVAVLQGLFLFIGLSSFIGNQMFDRMMLLFTEGSSYPPNHYVRKVPQRKLHLLTACQVLLLLVVCIFGFVDLFYMKMIFPLIILLLLPIRHKILPKIIETRYLVVLDT